MKNSKKKKGLTFLAPVEHVEVRALLERFALEGVLGPVHLLNADLQARGGQQFDICGGEYLGDVANVEGLGCVEVGALDPVVVLPVVLGVPLLVHLPVVLLHPHRKSVLLGLLRVLEL